MKHLKLFFALFAMLALGVGNAWADEVKWDLTTTSYSSSTDAEVIWSSSYVTATAIQGEGTKVTNYLAKGSQTRLYNKNTLSITPVSGYSINSIVITATGSSYVIKGTWTNGTSSTSDKIVTITPTDGTKTISCAISATCRLTEIKVLYESTSGGGETPEPVTISLDKTTLSLQEGENATLTATVTGSTEAVAWSSSTTGVASVDNTGKVTAVAAGEATITAAIGDVKATCEVTVTAATTPGTSSEGTLVITRSSFPSGTLAYNTTDNWSATASTGETVSGQGDLYSNATQTTMQTKNTGVSTHYHNTTAMPGSIKKISMEMASGTNRSYTVYASTSQISSTTGLTSIGTVKSGTPIEIDPAKGYKYFWLQCTGGASFLNNITITYETSGGGEPSTPTPSVSVAPTSHTFATTNVGETATQEFTITAENTTATLSASIDNTTDFAIIAITGDKVTVTYQPQSAGDHTATMTVKAGEEASTTVALTGKAVAALEGTWILVTDASSLKAGDEIIIAAKESDVALSTTQADNNRPEVAITKNDNTITATSETQVLTLQAGNKENTLALYTGDGYLYAASSGSNWLRTETTLSDNSSWSIAVAADGTATLIAQGTNTRNTLYYNKNSKIFSCYSNAQQPIALYKNTNGQQLAGLAYTTTKYLTKLGDAFTTPTLTNPNSLTVTYSSSDNNVATVDNTGTVTIKAAGVVVITAAFAGDASYLEGSATYTIGVTEHDGTQADPYSVADARRVIDVMETATDVYATGIVSKIVTAYNSTDGDITYDISVDGTTSVDQLQAYRGKSYNGASFTSADDIKVGDEVVVKGNLKKYNTTYEFDKENQLVSLVRNKAQADLAYAETELTANVGEDFAEPTLSNPYSLSITYSSSNTTLATINATTGEVTILAAGKVTITASTAGDATYAAGSASYNITITNPGLAVATLPFAFNGNKAAIETTAGMTQNGLGSDYSASTAPNSQLKFDGTGDWVVIRFDSEPEKLSYDIKNNSFSGGKFSVQESADGETYTDVAVHTTITDLQSEEYELNSASRYVKFIYTTKSSGNVGLGNISITKADHRAEAGIAWNPATVSLTVGDAFTAPTFNNPNGLSGITFVSDNETLATVDNAGAITLVSGKTGTATGTATITATFADGHAEYKPAKATCVITVSPKSEKVVILAKYGDQWYAMMAQYVSGKTSHLAALPVTYVGGKLYNVADADKTLIEWERAVVDGKATFSNNSKYLTGKSDKTDLTLAATSCNWTISGDSYLIGARTFLYNAENNWFRNFGTSNADNKNYSGMPTVTAPVYATGDAYSRSTTAGKFGTICLPFGSTNYTGATFYEFVGSETGKVYLGSVTTLEAGVPYIFEASAAEVAVYGDGTTAATPGYSNGLYGTFTDETPVAAGNYILLNNELRPSNGNAKVNANRAYIVMSEVPTGVPTQMPGRRYIGMSVQGENEETGFENITAPEGQAIKVISNGQLIIIRDGEMYNAQGQRL